MREKGVPGPGKLAGSRQGAQKGAEARHGAPSLRCGSVFRPSPRVPAPLRSGTATWSTRASGGTRKLCVDSHLDHDSAGCETAFPVSRETVLHVGLTLGRGDVMAHASRRRGSYRRHPSPSGASNAQRKQESWWREPRKGLVLRAKCCERQEGGEAGEGRLELW